MVTRSRSPSPTGPLQGANSSQREQVHGRNVTQAQQRPSRAKAFRSEHKEQDGLDATQSEEIASLATTKPEAMASPEHEDELFDVAENLDHVDKASTLQHFCSFVDYGPEDNCYVQASDMNGCETLVRQYWAAKDERSEEYWKQ